MAQSLGRLWSSLGWSRRSLWQGAREVTEVRLWLRVGLRRGRAPHSRRACQEREGKLGGSCPQESSHDRRPPQGSSTARMRRQSTVGIGWLTGSTHFFPPFPVFPVFPCSRTKLTEHRDRQSHGGVHMVLVLRNSKASEGSQILIILVVIFLYLQSHAPLQVDVTGQGTGRRPARSESVLVRHTAVTSPSGDSYWPLPRHWHLGRWRAVCKSSAGMAQFAGLPLATIARPVSV